jgi:hypothetical protein
VLAVSAIPASASTATSRAGPANAAPADAGPVPAGPANQMTGAERAALPPMAFSPTVPTSRFSYLSATSASPASPLLATNSVNSTFAFCNSNIACFDATLHFVSRTEFQLYSTQLIDSLCDSRSVYADVYDQSFFLGEFSNSMGCHTVGNFSSETISDPNGISYVQIELYACNLTSCSSDAWSLRHGNPY